MLDAPGGGAGTPWESMSIDQMQTLIQNPDTNKHYELLDGWKKSAELVSSHRWQVQSYRDNLAAVWPPAKSAASAAYLARLDALIANLGETYEAALANHDAFAAATLSISLAQNDMEKITQEYQTNKQLLLDFSTKQQEQQTSTTPSPTPNPGPSAAEPPVAPGRQDELKLKAVTLLSGVSADLAQAQIRIVRPAPYSQKFTDDTKAANEGQSYAAPPIPPITPHFPENGERSTSSSRSSVAFPTTGSTRPNSGPIGAASPSIQQPGLVLGGVHPPTITSPATGLNIIPPSAVSGGPNFNPNPGLLSPGTNTLLPNGGTAIPPGTNGIGRSISIPREGAIHPGASGTSGLRGMPPGGIIGGLPGGGPGQPGASRPGTRRVNPVGGVIGENTTNSNGKAGSRSVSGAEHMGGYGAPYGQGGVRKSHGNDQGNGSHWDPNNPWQTAEGVDPVLLPSREQRIDPGPAIGLS